LRKKGGDALHKPLLNEKKKLRPLGRNGGVQDLVGIVSFETRDPEVGVVVVKKEPKKAFA